MFIPDLTQFPACHPPSPYDQPVYCERNGIWGVVQLPQNAILYAVGWLDNHIPVTGIIPDECIIALLRASIQNAIIHEGMLGWYDCKLCSSDEQLYPNGKIGPIIHWQGQSHRIYGQGHHIVRLENVFYVCPALILHYILDHHYKPPEEFLKALIHGLILTYDDLYWKTENPLGKT
jgi:hypothetical protein